MKRTSITIIILLLFQQIVCAQVNTEKYRKLTESLGFSGTASIDATINTGNNDEKEVGVEGHFDYNFTKSLLLLIVKGDYGFVNGKEYSDQVLAHIRYLFRWNENLSLEIFSQYDFDKNRLLLNRKLFGGGIRPIVFRTENSQMWFGISYMYEIEKFDLTSNSIHPINDFESRLSSYITYRLNIEKNIGLSSVVYFQPEIGNWDDIKILSENSILVDVLKNVGLRIDFNLRYDSKPPDSIKKLDTKSEFGITFTF